MVGKADAMCVGVKFLSTVWRGEPLKGLVMVPLRISRGGGRIFQVFNEFESTLQTIQGGTTK